jgi:transcriptional regulator with XRE-family HTH domain
MPVDRHLCALLKLHRVACGVSQEALAKRMGSTVPEIEGYESGAIALTLEGFLTIARILGSPPPAAATLLEEGRAGDAAEDDARVAALLASQRGRQVVRALAHCEDPLVFDAFADLLLSVSMTQRSLPAHRRPAPAGARA